MNRQLAVAAAVMSAFCALEMSAAGAAQSTRPPKSITADEAAACIKTAVAARSGRVKDLEVNIDNGKAYCEVEIVASDGKKYEVHVDVAANKVARVED